MAAQTEQQQRFVSVCREVATNPKTSWVMFSHGTVIFLKTPDASADLAAEATSIMREYGPVAVGCSAGDFGSIDLDNEGERRKGWAVTGHHSDMLTIVLPDEVESESDIAVGLYGRSKRDADGASCVVIHVQDNRSS